MKDEMNDFEHWSEIYICEYIWVHINVNSISGIPIFV